MLSFIIFQFLSLFITHSNFDYKKTQIMVTNEGLKLLLRLKKSLLILIVWSVVESTNV